MTPFGEIYALSSAESSPIKNKEEIEDSYYEPASFDQTQDLQSIEASVLNYDDAFMNENDWQHYKPFCINPNLFALG
jgi:hypothetical protein